LLSDFKYPMDFKFPEKCRIPSDSDSDLDSVTSLISNCTCTPSFDFVHCVVSEQSQPPQHITPLAHLITQEPQPAENWASMPIVMATGPIIRHKLSLYLSDNLDHSSTLHELVTRLSHA